MVSAEPLVDHSATTDFKIKSVALTLFARNGYGATSIREIAAGVGIKTASLYHFFRSKEALLAEIIRESQTVLNGTTERMLEGVDRPEDRLALLVTSLAGFQGMYSAASVAADGEIRVFEPGSPIFLELVANRDRYEGWWVDALKQGAEEGVFTMGDPRTTRLALISMCTGVSQWYREDGPLSLADICQSLADIALSSVRAERDGRRLGVEDVRVFDLEDMTRIEWARAVVLRDKPRDGQVQP